MKTNFRTTMAELSVIVGFAGILALGLQGCGDISGDTAYNDNSGQDNSYTFTEGDRDYGSGTVLFCNDANCSVNASNSSSSASDGDAVVGEYDDSYTQSECQAAGFFYCTIEDKCLNQRVDDSSSSCNK